MPLEFVVTMAVATPPKLAEAPVAGAVNVTVAPLTGVPPEVKTVTCRAVENAALTVADCVAPALAVMLAGTAGAVLVRPNPAALPAPGAVADTV